MLSGKHNSYAARIYLGEPRAEERFKYNVVQIETIKIYYSPRLRIKEGCMGLRISLKKMLFAKWLEIDGAMGIVDKAK